MIKIPNYNVVVPTIPELRLDGNKRTDPNAERGELSYTFTAEQTFYVELPWTPTASEWIEVYVDNIRLINPRITSDIGGSLFETFNLVGNRGIKFAKPLNGEVKIICDTKATHWWGAVIVDPKNVQGEVEYVTLNDFVFNDWPIINGSVNGFNYRISFEPGPKFQSNTYIIVEGCQPPFFNGNYRVTGSTLSSVNFRGNVPRPPGTRIISPGVISGFGNGVVKRALDSVGLYAEPVIITQPYNGYARLTTDRKSIAYIPNLNYVGNDTFSWALINQRGQISEPKCVYIKIM